VIRSIATRTVKHTSPVPRRGTLRVGFFPIARAGSLNAHQALPRVHEDIRGHPNAAANNSVVPNPAIESTVSITDHVASVSFTSSLKKD